MRRAQITRESAGEMYEDVIDRVTAQATHRGDGASASSPRPLIKATVYLTPEDVLAIDKMQSDEFRATGKKPRRSTVVSRAIQLLLQTAEQQVTGDG